MPEPTNIPNLITGMLIGVSLGVAFLTYINHFEAINERIGQILNKEGK